MGQEVLEESQIDNGLGKMKKGVEGISNDIKRRMDNLFGNTQVAEQAKNCGKGTGRLCVATGKISKTTPESIDFHTPTSVLGVRG